jgi:coenzyme F420-0:L-glutamate ligase/coenzyme F420-1:gamma-L-glutamate ligase
LTTSRSLIVTPLLGIPLIQPGDDITQVIVDGLEKNGLSLQEGDALVITSKIISKSEGRIFTLAEVVPSAEAEALAEEVLKDPRLVELVLQESVAISRKAPNSLVVRHRLGFVSANAGLDQSNVDTDGQVLLLPLDPDGSAAKIHEDLKERFGVSVGIVVSDSHGRPFRLGTAGIAIGVAGMPALLDLRGNQDLFGRVLKVSMQGYADMVASAAQIVAGEGDEGLPIVLIRGLNYPQQAGKATDLCRSIEDDLYR